MSKTTFSTLLVLLFLFSFSSSVFAQINPLSAAEALQKIEHLQTTGSVLYIAAHPEAIERLIFLSLVAMGDKI